MRLLFPESLGGNGIVRTDELERNNLLIAKFAPSRIARRAKRFGASHLH
jgi:acyl-CoA synthetase (NDP forming)